MAETYARLIIQGRRTFTEVPEEVKDEVKRLLIEQGYEELLDV